MAVVANAGQHADWNGESGLRWAANADLRDRVLEPIARLLLAEAGIRAGQSVLDVGCGCGAVTMEAASSAGPAGRALGIDFSGPMLGLARRRAAERGIANVSFVQADAQTHPLPGAAFDIAVSRFGTMFFDDPMAAFANIAASLRRHASLCLVTWQPLAANQWLAVPAAALARHAATPGDQGAAGGPGMFAQSDPDALAATLRRAGFGAVRVTAATAAFNLGASPAEAASYLAGTGPARAALDSIPAQDRPAAIESIEAALREHAGTDGTDGTDGTGGTGGVRLQAAVWLTTASLAAGS